MKKTLALTALAAAAALALSGCGTGETEAEPTAPIASVGPSTSPSADPSPSATEDPEQVKDEAIADGRPEAAWDKDCVAWEMPEADTPEQEWANEIGHAYLESQDAKCPDAVTKPMYFMESFEPGADGELLINVDSTINDLMHGEADTVELDWMTYSFFNAVADAHPELDEVTATTTNGQRSTSLHRDDLAAAREYGGPLPTSTN